MTTQTVLLLVSLAPPSESVLKQIKSLAKERVQFFHIRQLQFDITTHRMAMPHRILKEDEQNAVFKKYNVTKPSEQLPLIDSQYDDKVDSGQFQVISSRSPVTATWRVLSCITATWCPT
jgi:DNA-directed RNA polymerase subunit H (RpoH/RPB5)